MSEQQFKWMPAVINMWQGQRGAIIIANKKLAKTIPPKSEIEILVRTKDGTVVEVTGRVDHVSVKRGTIRIGLSAPTVRALGAGPVLATVKNYDVPPLRK